MPSGGTTSDCSFAFVVRGQGLSGSSWIRAGGTMVTKPVVTKPVSVLRPTMCAHGASAPLRVPIPSTSSARAARNLPDAGGDRPKRVGAPQDDSQRRDEQSERQRRGERAEEGRIGRPGHRQDEDEPHVVGLPHRSHRAVGMLADLAAAFAATGEHLPNSGAEIRAGEDDAEGQSGEDEAQGKRLEHETSSLCRLGGGASQPVGCRLRR